MTTRAAASDDLGAIAAIQAASGEASQWDAASYLSYDCTVAVEGDRVLGFLVSRQTAPGEREIVNLGVEPRQRRRGVARELLRAELSRACGAWFLEVRESNAAALRLYETLGFQIAGRRPAYYHDPPEAAIVMKFVS